MLEREVKKNPALMAMLNGGKEEKEEKTEKVSKTTTPKKPSKNSKERNPKGYERNRGKGGTKPMSYYIPDELLKLLAIKAATDDKTKSELVVEGLRYVLRDELKASKNKKNEENKEEIA